MALAVGMLYGGNGRLSMRRKFYRTNNGNVSADDVHWWNTLGMRLEDIAIKGSGDCLKSLVTAYEGDYRLHEDVKTWLPYPVTATTGSFVSRATSASATYHSDSKARLISAVTEDMLDGTLTESYTYNFPGDVTNHTTSYTHGNVTDALSITYDYDLRCRMVESVSTLSLGGSTSSSVTTEYSYDALGRPSGQISTASGTGGTLNKVTVTDGYTLQGWLSSHQVKKGTQTLFTESLKYNSPSSSSGGNALYTGLISERSD